MAQRVVRFSSTRSRPVGGHYTRFGTIDGALEFAQRGHEPWLPRDAPRHGRQGGAYALPPSTNVSAAFLRAPWSSPSEGLSFIHPAIAPRALRLDAREFRGKFLNLLADDLDVNHDRVGLHRHIGGAH